MKLFSYGTLLIPEVMKKVLGFPLIPEKSVFIKGYKIFLTSGDYGYLISDYTGNMDDIVPGFLVEVPEENIARLDKYEGNRYKRRNIYCYDRLGNMLEAQIYVKN